MTAVPFRHADRIGVFGGRHVCSTLRWASFSRSSTNGGRCLRLTRPRPVVPAAVLAGSRFDDGFGDMLENLATGSGVFNSQVPFYFVDTAQGLGTIYEFDRGAESATTPG